MAEASKLACEGASGVRLDASKAVARPTGSGAFVAQAYQKAIGDKAITTEIVALKVCLLSLSMLGLVFGFARICASRCAAAV